MKKRLVALTLVAAMALGMTACGSKSESKISTNDTSANGTSHTSVSAGVDWTGYDELVDSIRTETDLAKRAEMMHQAEDMLMDTWCVIPLYYYNDQYMLKDYVTGVYSTVLSYQPGLTMICIAPLRSRQYPLMIFSLIPVGSVEIATFSISTA